MRRKLEQQQGLLDEPAELEESDFLESIARTIFRKGGGLLGELLNPAETGLDEGHLDDQGRLVVTEPLVRERNFRRWFGDSKIVDEKGKPLVVYHGTGADIKEFKPAGRQDKSSEEALDWFRDRISKNRNIPLHSWRMGSFFSPKPEYTDSYTNENKGMVYPVYLKAENPAWRDNVEKTYKVTNPKKTPDALIIHHNGDINEIVVPDPTQIKSIHNRGTYNPDDPDLLGMNTINMSLLYG